MATKTNWKITDFSPTIIFLLIVIPSFAYILGGIQLLIVAIIAPFLIELYRYVGGTTGKKMLKDTENQEEHKDE